MLSFFKKIHIFHSWKKFRVFLLPHCIKTGFKCGNCGKTKWHFTYFSSGDFLSEVERKEMRKKETGDQWQNVHYITTNEEKREKKERDR